VLISLTGHAQSVSGDPLGGVVNWIYIQLGRWLIMLAFMIVGIVMIAGRHTLEGFIFAALGVAFWIAAPKIAEAVANQVGSL
jgi:hypothetical protein